MKSGTIIEFQIISGRTQEVVNVVCERFCVCVFRAFVVNKLFQSANRHN